MKKILIAAIVIAGVGFALAISNGVNLFQASLTNKTFQTEGQIKQITSCEDIRQELMRYRKAGYSAPQSLLQMAVDFQCVAR